MNLLLANGADVNSVTDDGCSPLYFAANNAHKECMQLLFDNGASVVPAWERARTALYASAANGHWECMLMLIARGANVNLEEEDGTTPIWISAQRGFKNNVELLLTVGCTDVTADKGGFAGSTALDVALYGNADNRELLVAALTRTFSVCR